MLPIAVCGLNMIVARTHLERMQIRCKVVHQERGRSIM